MELKDLKNAIRVCELELSSNREQSALWNIIWDKDIKKDVLTNNKGRCYFIIVNDTLYKIGYSDCDNGIKGTIDAYRNNGNAGRPSDRTHGIHKLIAIELLKGNKVEFYFTPIKESIVILKTMDGETKNIEGVSCSGKILEKENISIFLEKEGKFPIWNLQEAGTAWPKHIQESRSNLCNNKVKVNIEDLKIYELI